MVTALFPEKNHDPITPWQTTVSNLVAKETMDTVTKGSMPSTQPITARDSQPMEIQDSQPSRNRPDVIETTGTVMDHSDLVPLPQPTSPTSQVSIPTIDLSDDLSDDVTPLDDVTETPVDNVPPQEVTEKKKKEVSKEESKSKGNMSCLPQKHVF